MSVLPYDPPTDPCILSKYVPNSEGYVSLTFTSNNKRKSIKEHRLVYVRANKLLLSDIKDKVVLHKCDTRNCVNPNHLLLGTVRDNNEDKLLKGRNIGFAKGNTYQRLGSGNTRLTLEQVEEIKTMRGTQAEIGRKFGITQAQVSNIVNGKAKYGK